MKTYLRQLGQGMTEYIIIVALIAIAAIAVYSFFGDTLRSQTGAITKELSGQSGADQTKAAQAAADAAAAQSEHKGLQSFTGGAEADSGN
jgi:Flp pilus assembly pilin Flp